MVLTREEYHALETALLVYANNLENMILMTELTNDSKVKDLERQLEVANELLGRLILEVESDGDDLEL